MPTKNRRDFVRQALEYYQRQTFKDTELVVVDNGDERVEDLCKGQPRVRYIYHSSVSTGELRNIACEAVKGSIIVHWDDDDWQADTRIHSLMNVVNENGKARLIGLRDQVYLLANSLEFWKYHYKSDKPWVAGNTMCYFKTLWQERPFADVKVGSDNIFCSNLSKEDVFQVPSNLEVIGLIHKSNTSPKKIQCVQWTKYAYMADLIGNDWSFYEKLAHEQTY